MDGEEPTTEELRLVQAERERDESELARDAGEPAEERTHERRAERAGYLREKLAQREAAERAAEER